MVIVDKETKHISSFEIGGIMSLNDILEMIKQLKEKLRKDEEILKGHNTKDNNLAYLRNCYIFYWLKFDYYNIESVTSKINELDAENGWFIWLKNYSVSSERSFKDQNERNSYLYDKYFNYLMPVLRDAGEQVGEAVFCYKERKYFACACTLFSCIENVQRSISDFDKSKIFSMSNEVKKEQTGSVVCFNKEYFMKFERRMNDYLSEHFYARSTEADPEPKEINRNRIMHGIFTRRVDKMDCLKLFVLLNSLLQFNDWLNCFRKMNEISALLEK